MKQQHTSAAGINLIEAFEDDVLVAYPDPGTGGAPWSIGRGHTGKGVYPGLRITQAQSDALFSQDLIAREREINALDLELNQNQFDALLSFYYNVGPGVKHVKDGLMTLRSGEPSTLLKKLRARDYVDAAEQFLLWINAAGKPMSGLKRRRSAERALFLKAV